MKNTLLLLFLLFITLNVFSQTKVRVYNEQTKKTEIKAHTNYIDLADIGGVYGVGQDSTTWQSNKDVLKLAFTLVDARLYTDIVVSDVFEFWLDNTSTITLDHEIHYNLVLKKQGKLDAKPEVTERWEVSTVDLFSNDGDGDANITFSGGEIEGKNQWNKLQTYNVILKPGGNTSQIEIQDTSTLYSKLWDYLEVGDTILYDEDNTNYGSQTGYSGIISAIDSTNSLITLNAALDAGIANDTEGASTTIGILFPWFVNQDTIDTYSKKWEFGSNNDPSGRHRLLYSTLGSSDLEDNGIVRFENTYIHDFQQVVESSTKIPKFEIYNTRVSKITNAFAIFQQTAPDSSLFDIIIEDLVMDSIGYFADGGILSQTQTSGIRGAGFYMHPNTSINWNRGQVKDCLAASVRQYSSSGNSTNTVTRRRYSVYSNISFESNTEYDLLMSGNMKTIVDNCRFMGPTVVYINNSTDVINTDIYNGKFVLNGGSTNEPTLLFENEYVIRFEGVNFYNSGIELSTWDQEEFDRTSIKVSDSHFVIDTSGQNSSIIVSSTTADNVDIQLLNNTYDFHSRLNAATTVDGSNDVVGYFMDLSTSLANITIDNLQPLEKDSIFRGAFINAPRLSVTAGHDSRVKILNSTVNFQTLINEASLSSFSPFINLQGTKFNGSRESQYVQVYDLPISENKEVVDEVSTTFLGNGGFPYYSTTGVTTFDGIAPISYRSSSYTGDELRYIFTKSISQTSTTDIRAYTTTNHYGLEGEVEITFLEDATIYAFSSSNAESNILHESDVTVSKGDIVTFKSIPYYPIQVDANKNTGVSETLVTASASTFEGSTSVVEKTAPFIPGTMTLQIVAESKTCPVDSKGFVKCDWVSGFVSNFNGGYSLAFDQAYTGDVTITGTTMTSPVGIGAFEIVSINGDGPVVTNPGGGTNTIQASLDTLWNHNYTTATFSIDNADLASASILSAFVNSDYVYIDSKLNSSATSDNVINMPNPADSLEFTRVIVTSRDLDTSSASEDEDTEIQVTPGFLLYKNSLLGEYTLAAGETIEMVCQEVDGTYYWVIVSATNGFQSSATFSSASPTIYMERSMTYFLDAATAGLTTYTFDVSDLAPGDFGTLVILGADSGNTATIDLTSGNWIYDNLSGDGTEAFSGSYQSFRWEWNGTNMRLIGQ